MQIKLKNITGKVSDYNIESDDNVLSLKEQITEKEGIPVDQIKLLASGSQLADESKIGDYKISAGDTVHMVLSLRGGR